MNLRIWRINYLFAGLVIIYLLSGCSKNVAVFNGGSIKNSELRKRLEKIDENVLKKNKDNREFILTEIKKIAADMILKIEAIEQGIDKEPDYIKSVNSYKKRLYNNTLVNRNAVKNVSVGFSDFEKYYADLDLRLIILNIPVFPKKSELAEIKKRSKRILKEAKKSTNFAELADKYTENSMNFKGGDVGYFAYYERDKEFSAIAFGLKEGAVSKPVRTKDGFQIIKIEDVKFEKGRKYVQARNILLKIPSNINQEELRKIKEKAQDIYEKAVNGEDFAEMANKYTEDPDNKKGGSIGVKGYFDLLNPVADAAYRAGEGNIAYYFNKNIGCFIIKVEKITKKSSSEIKEMMKNKRDINECKKRKRITLGNNKNNDFYYKLISDNRIERNYSLLTNDTANSNDVIVRINIVKDHESVEENDRILKLKNVTSLIPSKEGWDFDFIVRELEKKYLLYKLLYLKAIDEKIDKEKKVFKLLKRYSDEVLVRLLKKRIPFKFDPTENELRKFYNNRKNKYFSFQNKKKKILSYWEVHDRVRKDLEFVQRRKTEQQYIDGLYSKYNLIINPPGVDRAGAKKIKVKADKYFKMEENQKALNLYQKVINRDPAIADVYLNMASIYLKLENSEKADEKLSEITNISDLTFDEPVKFLDYEESIIRKAAVNVCIITKKSEILPVLISKYIKCKFSEKQVYIRAFGALAKKGDVDIVNFLLSNYKILEESDKKIDYWLKLETIKSLGKIGGDKRISDLIKDIIVNEQDKITKLYAIEALGNMHDRSSISLLSGYLNNPDWEIKKYVAESLKKITRSK